MAELSAARRKINTVRVVDAKYQICAEHTPWLPVIAASPERLQPMELDGVRDLDGSVKGGEDLRPIHYIGNKSRYLTAIEQAVDSVARPGSSACDLFAGTAVVSRRLAQRRPVVSADVQAYSQVLARALTRPTRFQTRDQDALIEVADDWLATMRSQFDQLLAFEARAMDSATSTPTDLAALVERGSFAISEHRATELDEIKARIRELVRPDDATLTWYYGGTYFSFAQALELDALRHAARVTGGPTRNDTMVAAVMGAASDAVSTVGNHFAQPTQPRNRDGSLKRSWVGSVIRRRQYSVLQGFRQWLGRYAELRETPFLCHAVQSTFESTLSTLGPEVGVIYADPPYTRDHYSRFYHVLETIALDDDPGVTRALGSDEPSRGLYRTERHQSPFSIRTQVEGAFRNLMAEAKRLDVPLVLSYSPMSAGTKARPETRLMSIDGLVEAAEDYFADVRLIDVEASSHSRFNRLELNADNRGAAEVLIVAQT